MTEVEEQTCALLTQSIVHLMIWRMNNNTSTTIEQDIEWATDTVLEINEGIRFAE